MKAQLSATAEQRRVSLRAAAPFSDIQVDPDAGVIRNVAVMYATEAKGHGFLLDNTSLQQTVECIQAAGDRGVKMRFHHPPADDASFDDLGEDVGYLRNARLDTSGVPWVIRGDVHLGEWAKSLPGRGDVWSYLLTKAEKDPAGFGLSAVINFELEEQLDGGGNVTALVARVAAVEAVDFVGQGAATPHGLLSVPSQQQQHIKPAAAKPAAQLKRKTLMEYDPKMNDLLRAKFGMGEGTDDDAKAFFSSLDDEQKGELAKLMEGDGEPKPAAPPAQMSAKRKAVVTDAGDEFLALEGKRVAQLQQLGNTLGVDASVVTLAIADGDDVTKARTRYLKALQEKCKPVAAASVRVGDDKAVASLRAALPHAIMLRGDVRVEKPHERAAQLRHLTLIDMGRHYFASLGVKNVWELSRTKMAEIMLSPRAAARVLGGTAMLAQSTSDFDNILADTIGKSLRQAYLDAPGSWSIWARRATAPDFKTISRTSLSESPDLVSRKEGGEVKYVSLSDGKETYTLAEYVGGIKLTRQAIINDDLDAFSRVPTLQANAAKRKEDDVAYAILTANAALSDSVALFHASHANLGTGAVISITSLAEARKQMRVQKGPKSAAILNLRPKYLIVPAALESVAEQYTSSQFVAATSATINPFAQGNRSALVPVIEPRLDANSATAWYTAADNTQIDTVEVCFLADEPEPVLKSETDWDTEDQKYAVRHTVAAKAIDYRGLTKNAGA